MLCIFHHVSPMMLKTMLKTKQVRVWDAMTRSLLRMTRLDSPASCVDYSPDGELLVVGFGARERSHATDAFGYVVWILQLLLLPLLLLLLLLRLLLLLPWAYCVKLHRWRSLCESPARLVMQSIEPKTSDSYARRLAKARLSSETGSKCEAKWWGLPWYRCYRSRWSHFSRNILGLPATAIKEQPLPIVGVSFGALI